MIAVGMWLAVALSAAGYGLGLAGVARLDFVGRLERLVASGLLGSGFLATAVFVMGIAGQFNRLAFALLILPGIAQGVRLLRRPGAPSAPVAGPAWIRHLLVGLLGACVLATIVGALAPPSFVDALVYHLYGPKEYLRRGALAELQSVWQLYQPTAVEMLYTLGLGLRSASVAALMGAWLGLLAAGAAALLGSRLGGPLAGLVAAAAFYCGAMVAWESTSCFVDLGVAAFGTLSLYAVLRAVEGESRRWLAVGGLLAGLAASCKLNGALFVALGSAMVLHERLRRGYALGGSLRRAGAFGAIGLAMVLPWYIRAYLLTGNPVYPFAVRLFGDNPDIAPAQWVFQHYGMGYSALDLLLAPWRLLRKGARFENGQHLSPLPIMLAPLIVAGAVRKGENRALLGASALMFAFWLATAQVARYLLPIQAIGAALAGDAFAGALGGGALRRRAVLAVALGSIAVGTANTLVYDRQFLPVVFGLETDAAYLGRTAWFYAVHQEVNREVPADARLLTDLAPTYYLERPHLRARPGVFAGADLAGTLANGGFTHVLLHADPEAERSVSAVPGVELMWTRDAENASSRTFGGTVKHRVSLFRVGTVAKGQVP